MRTLFWIFLLIIGTTWGRVVNAADDLPRLRVSANGRHFMTEKGDPFFWLGDTGWLLLTKLNREEADDYLEDRRKKGFNVIQVMVLHDLKDATVYGAPALENGDIARPGVTPGSAFDGGAQGGGSDVGGADSGNGRGQYDYWDHLDYIVKRAAEKGIYVALVPVWGSVVKSAKISAAKARVYAGFLAERYKASPNVVWMNGGDIKGTDSFGVWTAIGAALRAKDPGHLITFHPRGRASSSFWFEEQGWLDFNSVQSGHRNYAQDTSKGDPHYGEDNWKYIQADYKRTPVRPVLDAEPSYEQIPYGLHDTLLPRWTDKDVRRYGYWSVFAGACGYTYGDNSVMQFLKPTDKGSAYGAKTPWSQAIHDPGAGQMHWLKALLLSRPYFERVPDETLIAGQGERYDYLAATRGRRYAFIYTCNGRTMKINMGKIEGELVKASWYNPRDGSQQDIGLLVNKGVHVFDPPGELVNGNDWVLVLDGTEGQVVPDAGQASVAQPAETEKNVYLFTSFREPATEGLYFLYSYDGYHWNDLGGPWLRPEIGDKRLMRDPSMARGPDGEWHLVWTTGWNGDKGFGYASSKDLIHWSAQQFIPVMQNEPDAFNVWAPEIFYEQDSAAFVIVWATTIPFRFARGQEEEKNNHRLYYTTTRDFKTYSPTRLFYDPGYSVIDAMILQRGAGDYVLVFKDNTRPQRTIKVAFSDRATGGWHDDSPAFTPVFTEGPAATKVGKDWLIYYDMYRDKKYGAMRTTDFKTFMDVTGQVSIPAGHKHGTIVLIDKMTLERLQQAAAAFPQNTTK